jgi:hypothetical protein
MRYQLTMLAGIAFACAVCGCSIFPRYRYHYYESSSSSDTAQKDPRYVTVELDGDVRLPGPRPIRQELSKEAVVEAAGGFAGLSKAPPASVTLIRAGQKQVIPFAEMGQGKWKGFQLQEGDRLVVNFQFF